MVISNAIVCDEDGEREVDIRIKDGIITEMAKGLTCSDVVDAKGAYFLPLLRDLNVRLQDSILNSKNIKRISDEALLGGVGQVVLNADSNPAIDSEIVLEFAQNGLHDLDGADVELMLNALKEDATLSNIAILLKRGATNPYMSTIAKNDVAIKIAEYCKMYDVELFCKAEDNSLIQSGVMLDGDISSKLGLAGIPVLSEVLHVSRMIEIARHFKIKILFKSIASPRSISLITQAKKDGVGVRCEVSIHHLVNSDATCENFNTTAKLDPPLASSADMLELQKALKNGEIDVLTTLHQPSSPVNKEVAFYDADYGCEALADAMPLYYTKLVKSNMITMSELLKLTTNDSKIEVGKDISAMLLNVDNSYKVTNSQSLYNDETLYGVLEQTFTS